jgi:ATP-dependent RNA helicase DeaD
VIVVGRAHQVKPTNIVGAIANESGLDSRFIGKIMIFDEYSTVDLRAGMPRELLNMLKKVWVSGRQLNITRLDEAPAPAPEARPFVDKPKAPAPAEEDRPVAKKPKAIPDRKDRPVGKKFKTKSKPKRAIAKSKGSRSSGKRLQRTR